MNTDGDKVLATLLKDSDKALSKAKSLAATKFSGQPRKSMRILDCSYFPDQDNSMN
ncbi:MAG: hypothetical protein AB7E32_08965 [Desulfovibrio sp.]